MANFKRLFEITDKAAREELGEYYIVSKSRMDNLIHIQETAAATIKQLSTLIAEQAEEIKRLTFEEGM